MKKCVAILLHWWICGRLSFQDGGHSGWAYVYTNARIWAASSEFVSSSIPSWKILTPSGGSRGVRGVQTNSLLSRSYFIFMGNFRKNWPNCTNRTPLANLNPAPIMPSHSEGQGIWLSVWRFLLTHCFMSEQQRFWRDCADGQARLNLRCSHRR